MARRRHAIHLKRAYAAAAPEDGQRLLIDALWPRGVSKEALQAEAWLKGLAPSTALRTWFGHDPARWEAFRERYFAELEANPQAVAELRAYLDRGAVTLLYGARDETHNNAVALRQWLQSKPASGRR
ncbi:hypothetical protein B1992_05590 [Pseudoxanthomonas broegbernensis]|uniref:DUF488 domain-containing protein n=1 Tax=Pseudoxanthomonas broegbernensis TaxID=83619 RepID=A0A7V8GN41_9GAMM|nr:DUF488 family protein [Pseudoxanthomonas broegbernensis]KAF1686866.1 hypothetical protein B1992_05590 [Pseudoxanthomonas broegbernensis]MBB6065544.1 uncharacterized protein YeaO (DUF488 family) [Pseudoxanthomonas broegbernensis]